jgi:hypothetical protein
MLRRMPINNVEMHETEALRLPFEACDAFVARDGSPVCDHCGWLDTDHGSEQLAA